MTTNENDQTIPFDSLTASIFTQMAKDAAWTQNQLDEINKREIREWQMKFLDLFTEIHQANKTVDSFRIDRILDGFGRAAMTASRGLDS